MPNTFQFFLVFIFPYLLVVTMAYVGARVLFALGNEVRKARELGSYRLLERIGAGGMGEVWRASHRLLARPAAIKLIRPSQSPATGAVDAAARRFEREAQAIASLRSPHTVTLFDFGIADDGTFYYVMELLEGLDAERLVRRFGPLPAERVIHVVRQMCHSLSEAESVGLVHRDIKPANIILCRYGEDYDFVKLLDFGIVKAVHDPAGNDAAATVTEEHVVQGTPAFIAPEQALGAATVDNRLDIYSTGCVAYWLRTGQLVFTADTPMGLVLPRSHTAQPAIIADRTLDSTGARRSHPVVPREESRRSSSDRARAGPPARCHSSDQRLERAAGARVVGTSPASITASVRGASWPISIISQHPAAAPPFTTWLLLAHPPRDGRYGTATI